MEHCYKQASTQLLRLLRDEFHLHDHMLALKHFLLLGQGDFIQSLMELLAYVQRFACLGFDSCQNANPAPEDPCRERTLSASLDWCLAPGSWLVLMLRFIHKREHPSYARGA